MNNANHPKAGSSIKVEPIRKKVAIDRIKGNLLHRGAYRDHCFFTLGINTAFRANELLSLTLGQVAYLRAGDALSVKQSKNRKHRTVTLNRVAYQAVQDYLKHDSFLRDADDDQPLFYSKKGWVLSVPTVSRMVKHWCQDAGLRGNYGSHTMRKTWGYWQYKRGKPLPLLMEAFGHATQQQTLAYLCIQSQDVQEIYDLEL